RPPCSTLLPYTTLFRSMVAALGGPGDVLERPDAWLAQAPVQRAVPALVEGHATAIDVRALGQVVVSLGGGRRFPGQQLDHTVGLDRKSTRLNSSHVKNL